MSHSIHDEDTIFQDGCSECEHRVARGVMEALLTQDAPRVEALWRRMIAIERPSLPMAAVDGWITAHGYRSHLEAKIGRELYHLAVLLERSDRPGMAWQPGLFYREGGK